MRNFSIDYKYDGQPVTWAPQNIKLLTPEHGNTKIAKSGKVQKVFKTACLHLAPANASGYEVCAGRSKGCTEACLNRSGQGGMYREKDQTLGDIRIHIARGGKTAMLFEKRDLFFAQLKKEISAFVVKCENNSEKPCIRLNTTSDLPWESIKDPETKKSIIALFPMVQFYDYTKVFSRIKKNKLPSNYFIVFSRSESNEIQAFEALSKGFNVAVVFEKELPAEWNGFPVINGDKSDLRFLDNEIFGYENQAVVVGLIPKGRFGKRDNSGFVVREQVEYKVAA